MTHAAKCMEIPNLFNPIFLMRVSRVFPLESVRIGKNGGRFLEGDAILCEIPGGFWASQANTIYVYTVISTPVKGKQFRP